MTAFAFRWGTSPGASLSEQLIPPMALPRTWQSSKDIEVARRPPSPPHSDLSPWINRGKIAVVRNQRVSVLIGS